MSDRRPRILAIDDTPANLMTLGSALALDFDLQIATSGAMGLAMAAESLPDLILLDVMMPDLDGFEVCRRLKAGSPQQDIPIVFVTALEALEAESKGLAMGAADYILKPINVEIARQRIRNLLERERLRKEVEAHRDQLETRVAERTLALSIAKEAAEAANRSKSVFLANMSHELRTPMSAIMGMNALALQRATDLKQIDYLKKVEQASQRLLALIGDLLDISSIEADRLTLERTEFRLETVLAPVAERLCCDAAAKDLTCALNIPAALGAITLWGDPSRLGQILFNLTSNAVKFTREGSVSLNVELIEERPQDLLLRIEVSDTGIGISPEDQARLFTAFEQLDGSMTRQYGGSGLGLALSQRLARMMGGSIQVDSRLGVGSAFSLLIWVRRSRR